MKILDRYDIEQILNAVKELRQLNAFLWHIKEVLAEDDNGLSESQLAEKIHYIYEKQRLLHKKIEIILEGGIVV